MHFKTDTWPFSLKEVRRAMFIGTDRGTISDMIMEPDRLYHYWPMRKGFTGWVPLEELPAETRLLYDYDPDLATQMLRDAGVPDGFKMKMLVDVTEPMPDAAELIADLFDLVTKLPRRNLS